MIEISKPIPVFDENHNVIQFKYNDGLVIHDCLTNTLNISYLIVRELISDTKSIDDVLSELKEHFSLFSYVKCHDRDFIIDLIKDLIIHDEMYPNRVFWLTNGGEFMLEYDKNTMRRHVSFEKIWSLFEKEFDYHPYRTKFLFTAVLSEHFNLNLIVSNSEATNFPII